MSKKKIADKNNYYRHVKIAIAPDHYVETMLRKNCRYRHFLYNKCVEIVRSLEENHPKGYIGEFSEYDLLAYIRDLYESNIIYSFRDELRPEWMEDYDYYFRGISECVVDDIMRIINRIKTERKCGNKSDIHFRGFDPNRMTFKFKNKIHTERKPNKNGMYQGNSIELVKNNPYLIGIKINNTYGYPLGIRLREDITKFNIDLNMIKDICFSYHNGKWYIIFTEERRKINTDIINIRYKREKISGIDLGETNPVVLYNGKEIVKIPENLQYPKKKLANARKRIKRLQAVLDRKRNPDADKFHQSKNYYKVLVKFHKAWERLINLKKEWHFKLAHWIVTHYKNIVVDEFHDYTKRISSNYPVIVRRTINRSYQDKAVGILTQRLKHMAIKYKCNYYMVDKDRSSNNRKKVIYETTNRCSKKNCNHINSTKLTLD